MPHFGSENSVYCYEYIWLDADQVPRSKTKVMKYVPNTELPDWNYDGSSTGQADTTNSEVILSPVAVYPNPFVPAGGKLVLCQTQKRDGRHVVATDTNTRHHCANVLTFHKDKEPMFGAELEFFMRDIKTGLPLGYAADGTTPAQGRYYCGVGAGCAYGRAFVDKVLGLAIRMGLGITGSNFEVAPGQAEIQVCGVGIKAADDLIMLKYLLRRVGEEAGIEIDLTPKPLEGDWNGSGCHINFSTKAMRTPTTNAYAEHILPAVQALADTHAEHLAVYGAGNDARLTGAHETSSYDRFTYGVADRSASVRIPADTKARGYGYIEDRRPGANVDPYLAYARIVETICGPYGVAGEGAPAPQIA
jgi:glutamine synthetase